MSTIDYETVIGNISDLSLQEKIQMNVIGRTLLQFKRRISSILLSQKAVLAFLPFATTCKCETVFSAYALTKNKIPQ